MKKTKNTLVALKTAGLVFLSLFVIFLATISAKTGNLSLQTDVCAQKRAVLIRVTNELKTTRNVIKRDEADLKVAEKNVIEAGADVEKYRQARSLLPQGSLKAHGLTLLINNAEARRLTQQKNVSSIKVHLAKQRKEETYLVNQLHLIRDYVDAKCPAEPKPKPQGEIPSIAGNYNSPYGRTSLTMTRNGPAATVTAIVYYNGGDGSPDKGTSRLTGPFDGKTWRYRWRNSYGHYGTGVMTYNSDESLTGYWINDKDKTRGKWWLRPR